MENIKSAEDFIRDNYDLSEDGLYGEVISTDYVYTVKDLARDFDRYADLKAAQFQTKWIEGVPDDHRDLTLLMIDGYVKEGWYDKKSDSWVIYLDDVIVDSDKVIAYSEIITPEIPDHLKAKIK